MLSAIIGVFANTMNYSNRAFENVEKQYVNSKYIKAIEKNGGIPLIIPVTECEERLTALISLCDGILFPGGEDIDPALYGEDPHNKLGEIKPSIDQMLLKAFEIVNKQKIPTLGICKGMQLLVAFTGGTLYQDIYSQRKEESLLHCQYVNRDYGLHKVIIEKNSQLANILGVDTIMTNSLHHQSVKNIGKIMKATAHTTDGIIEAVESKDGILIGVQWHPEEMIECSIAMNNLFSNLVERALKGKDSRK